MAFELLDPRIQQVLRDKDIHEPTGPQREAIPIILQGDHLLLVAHTGIGKTEAAMLPIFHRLLDTAGKGIKCIYITPLRALNRDMLKRLTEFGEALDLDVAVRHGDTSQAERQRQSKSPPDVLITTPETVQVLFTGKRLREHLSRVKWVVIDEIHELASNERGAQLSVAMERLVEVAGEFQRIGLSATVGSVEEVAGYLGGEGRKVRTVRAQVSKDLDVTVQAPPVTDADRDLAGRLQSDPHLVSGMRRCKTLIERHRSTLMFVNTRDTAEAMAARYHIWDESIRIGVHHGSLSKEIRIETEEDFKAERLKGLICTSSLELGIDIGSVDFAIQYNSPRQVSRLIQRMGRAGHSVGERSEGAIVASNADEIAESMVIARMASDGELERLRVRERPMTVLANQLVAMGMSGQTEKELAYQVIKRSYPFRNLGRDEFHGVLEQLVSIGLLFDNDATFRRTSRGMRYFYDNISMIPDERTYLIRDIATRRVVGTLDESFVLSFAEPYAAFITHGKTWRIVEVREDELLVEQIRDIGSIPSWTGEDIPVPFEVAQEVGRLRRERKYGEYAGDADAVEELDRYLKEQDRDGAVPSDKLVTLEMGKRMAVLNMCFGTKVNETVSKVLSVLLSARLGESVGAHTDPYRIVIELPRDINPQIIIDTLGTMRSEGVESLVRLVLKTSSHLRYRFVFVAKKFGVIDKDADHRQVNFTRLAEAFEGTPLFEEAVRRSLWEDFDVEGTMAAMKRLESGETTLKVMGLTSIGRAGLQHSRDLIMPQRADHSILMALKKRLESEVMSMSCLNCQAQWRLKPQDAPDRLVCPRCGGQMIAALLPYNKQDIGLLKKEKPTEEEAKEIRRMYKNASLVREHGRRAMLTLAGRGIGPDTADRVLSSFYDDEDEFLRDILSAELTYARTKRFWD
ncbi:MAG: DEAD/DEAH box helicase [Methanomassiliicoccus sp.]|nr:DEAD/DEAH box helicase [Methanomassiliicoccus sp.]